MTTKVTEEQEMSDRNGDDDRTETSAVSLEEATAEVHVGDSIYDAANILEAAYPGLMCIGKDWYLPQNGVYQLYDTNLIGPKALSVLTKEKQTAHCARAVIDTLEMRKQVPRDTLRSFARFENHERSQVLLCCGNGVLRVTPDVIELLPHSLDYAFGRQLAANYRPEAKCPLFINTIRTALPDKNDRDLAHAFSAYTLYPANDIQVFLICYGESGTSKTTIWHGYTSAIGEASITRIGFPELCGNGNGYSLPSLERTALNLGAEAPQGELQESDVLKLLVEGAPIKVRSIYERPRTMHDYHMKIVVLGNYIPRFKSGTTAELRRLRILHFQHQHGQSDPTLEARIALERDGIFSRCMVPWLKWLLRERQIPMGGVAAQRLYSRYKTTHDPYGTFIKECCDLDRRTDDVNCLSDTKDRIFGAFECFIERNDLADGLREERWFFRRLRERVPHLKNSRPGSSDGQRERRLVGIRVKEGVTTEPHSISVNERHNTRQQLDY